MRIYRVVISKDAPSQRDVLWAKPTDGGYVMYLLDAGKWQPLKVVNDYETGDEADDVPMSLLDGIKVNGTQLEPNEDKVVNLPIIEGTTNGTIKVNGTNVKVHGLGSAAYTASTAYDASGAATTAAEGAIATVVGQQGDSWEHGEHTLYGLKAYIDSLQ